MVEEKMFDEAQYLSVYKIAILPLSRKIAKLIHPYQKEYSKRSYDNEINTIQQIILNFEYNRKELETKMIVVPLQTRYYSKNKKLGKLHFEYLVIRRVIKILEEKELIVKYLGFQNRTTGFSRSTRIEMTDKLENLLDSTTLDQSDDIPTYDEVMVRKANSKVNLNYKETDFTAKARVFIKNYNAFLADSDISLPEEISKISNNDPRRKVSYPYLYRIFNINNGSMKHGGRFYPWGKKKVPYINIKKQDRAKIKIDNEPSIEIDYACLHINLAYLSLGLQGPKTDIYNSIDFDIDRDTKKKMILIMINSKDNKSAEKALVEWSRETYQIKTFKKGKEIIKDKRGQSQLEEKGKTAKALRIKIEETFPEISSLFCSNLGIKLQFHDSEIMEMILKECFKLGITALPIHDSILIKESERERGIKIMRECYQTYCKKAFNLTFTPEIDIK